MSAPRSINDCVYRQALIVELDYRWDATAVGWARVALKDEKMAQWLEEAERGREQGGR